jgi:hypothetical protein
MSATMKSSSSSSSRISRGRNSSSSPSSSSSSSPASSNVAYGQRWPSARDFHSPTLSCRGGARGASPGEGGGRWRRPPCRRRGTNGWPGGCGGRRSRRAWWATRSARILIVVRRTLPHLRDLLRSLLYSPAGVAVFLSDLLA